MQTFFNDFFFKMYMERGRGLTYQVRDYSFYDIILPHLILAYIKRAKLFVAYHPVVPTTESVGRYCHSLERKGKKRDD